MLTNRLIACFDVRNGMVTKAHQFNDNFDIDTAINMAKKVYQLQVDEVVFYDITASIEKRKINIDTIREVAKYLFVPFTVGGGIESLEDMYEVLKAGAEKISLDSMAVRNPSLISDGAKAFGRQCVVSSMQVKRVGKSITIPSGYEIFIDGAKVATGLDAIDWSRRVEDLGAGEICINSVDMDGTHKGFDLEITSQISDIVNVPVIASGGGGHPNHVVELFTKTSAMAAIISSLLYSPRLARNYSIQEIKEAMAASDIPIRKIVNCSVEKNKP